MCLFSFSVVGIRLDDMHSYLCSALRVIKNCSSSKVGSPSMPPRYDLDRGGSLWAPSPNDLEFDRYVRGYSNYAEMCVFFNFHASRILKDRK